MTKERKDKPDKNIADAFKNVRKDVVDHSGNSGGGTHTPFDDLLVAMSEAMPDAPDIPGITKEDKVKSMFTMLLVKLGVSPEEYAASYEMLHQMFEIMGKSRRFCRVILPAHSYCDKCLYARSFLVYGEVNL